MFHFLIYIASFSGVSHCDELGYLYSCAFNTGKIIEKGSLADVTIERMTTMWTNFLKTG